MLNFDLSLIFMILGFVSVIIAFGTTIFDVSITSGAKDAEGDVCKYITTFEIEADKTALTEDFAEAILFLTALAPEFAGGATEKSYCGILGVRVSLSVAPADIGLISFETGALPVGQEAEAVRRRHKALYKDGLNNSKHLSTPEPINVDDVVASESDVIEFLGKIGVLNISLLSVKGLKIINFEQSIYNAE